MRKNWIALLTAGALLATTSCGLAEKAAPAADWAVEKLNDGLAQVGSGVVAALDAIHYADYPGGPFENNMDSAREYLLAQLKEKYGKEFVIAGDEDLENYGLLAGATYTCKAAPADNPEEVVTALVSQSRFRDVRDDYAVYFFAEAAEEPVAALCESKDYVLDQQISLEMPETEKTWKEDDPLSQFLSESGAYVKVVLRLEDGLDTEIYAEQILDFICSAQDLGCDLLLQARANKTYIFHRELSFLEGFSADDCDAESIEEDVIENIQMGDPRAFADAPS